MYRIKLTEEQIYEMVHVFENYAMAMDEIIRGTSVKQFIQQFTDQKESAGKLLEEIMRQVEQDE